MIETLNPTLQWVRYKLDIPDAGNYRLEALYSADEQCPITVQVNGKNVTEDGLNPATGGWDLKFRRWEPVADFDLRAGPEFPAHDAKGRQLSAHRQIPPLQSRRPF